MDFETKPNHMHVIRHQHVSRAGEFVTSAGMEQDQLPRLVKCRVEPTGPRMLNPMSPVDKRMPSVEFRREPREVAFT